MRDPLLRPEDDVHAPGVASQSVRFAARDGVGLTGRLFAAPAPRVAALVAPATGVPARYYRHFAAHVAARGATALTFDYRGIGDSLQGHVRDSRARKQDWGQLDLPAALDELARRAPGLPLTLVGHSAGGQLAGLMDNARELRRVVQVAGSSGYLGGLAWRLRPVGHLLLRVWLPLSVRLVGYGAARRIGWGEDLPAGVALQWRDWCVSPGYFESSLGGSITRDHLADVRCPALNLCASDDSIATEANVRDLVRLFPSAAFELERIDVRTAGVGPIGHVGFFRPRCAPLWDRVVDFVLAAGAEAQ